MRHYLSSPWSHLFRNLSCFTPLLACAGLAAVSIGCTGSGATIGDSVTDPVKESGSGSSPSSEPAAPEAVADEAETFSNTIRWSTASEVDNFGFDVFRGDSEDGPFERLNSQVIEGGGTIDTPRKYAFEDDTIDPCSVYFYYVESIALDGSREKFTPVGRARAKLEADEPRCRSRVD